MTEIFPGGRLPSIEKVEEHSTKAGFKVTRIQSLQSDFAKTLDMWADVLESRKDEAIAIQSEEVYERYMKFLRGTVGQIPCRLHRHQSVHDGEVVQFVGRRAPYGWLEKCRSRVGLPIKSVTLRARNLITHYQEAS